MLLVPELWIVGLVLFLLGVACAVIDRIKIRFYFEKDGELSDAYRHSFQRSHLLASVFLALAGIGIILLDVWLK